MSKTDHARVAVFLGLLFGGGLGCSGENEPVTVDQAFFEDTTAGEVRWLDLRPEDAVVRFEANLGDAAFSEVGFICPDGAAMLVSEWVEARRGELLDPLFPVGRWAVGSDELAVREANQSDDEGCEQRCSLCPDGVWICDRCEIDTSLPARSLDQGQASGGDERIGEEAEEPLRAIDDGPRPDESSSGDGSGSSGSGGGGRSGSGSSGGGSGSAGQPGF